MRINVFSPVPPARTSIAQDLWHSLPALRKLAEITLWTHQEAWDERLTEWAEVKRFPPERGFWSELHRADMTVYHIGNNAKCHGEIWRVSCAHPGVVVLHDLSLQHLFADLFLNHHQDPGRYLSVMQSQYGEAGRRAAESFIRGRSVLEDLATRFPLTRLALENALGVLVHTRVAYEALAACGRWPVARAGLPFTAHPRPAERAHRPDGVRRLIIFGFLGPKRRIESVLRALALLPDRDRYRLDIYGEVWDPRLLRHLATTLGIRDLVHLHGFVTDETLERALETADLAINLRYPTMGEASGSQLRIWSHALPSLVTNVDWYSEIPEGAVGFVYREREVADIRRHLETLFSNPAALRRMGEKGRRLLEAEHSPERYARRIVALASTAARFRARAAVFQAAERLASEVPRLSSTLATAAAEAMLWVLGEEELPLPEGAPRPLVEEAIAAPSDPPMSTGAGDATPRGEAPPDAPGRLPTA